MGIFERLGRQVEQFKQTAEQAAEESASYECRACGERFHSAHDECPECGADAVTQANTEE